jgi:hypothetical protein
MAKKGGSSAPPAPDPVQVANAQSQSNIATAREQQRLNMINTYGPQGSVVYGADPNAPGGYSQTTSLSPSEQQTYDLSKQAENAALGLAGQQIGRVGDALSTPLNMDGLPALRGGDQLTARVLGLQPGQGLQSTFDPGQAIQGSVGGDLEAARKAMTDAVYGQATSRLDPMWQQREDQARVRLANQGLTEGSTAYDTALANLGRDRNDAYNQAAYSSIGAGEQAAQALFGRQLGQGQFANQAAGQMYEQNRGLAQFGNDVQQQGWDQSLQQIQAQIAAGQFANQARQQGMQERAYLQNQPINQFSALLGSGQVGMPQGVQYTPSQVAPTDVVGSYALKTQADQAAANRRAQQSSGLMGGLFSLGSAAIMASDERLKKDVKKVGERPDGIGVYEYRYKAGGPKQLGVLAQEVRKVRPDAVRKTSDGYLAVDYGAL